MEPGPIFIGGLAYSGKTMLRLRLSAHPNIVLTRRAYMWPRFYGRYGDLGQSDNLERCLTAMLEHKDIQTLEPDPDRIRREFRQGPPTYARLFALFQAHYAQRVGKPRWGEQLGFIEQYADPIFAAFPAAKMIHMVRDPRDRYEISATRCRQRPGKVGWDTARWLYSVSLAIRNQRRYPGRYKIVRYETLVSRPEETLREICSFLDEDFVPGMVPVAGAIKFGERPDSGTEGGTDKAVSDDGSPGMMSKRELAFTQTVAKQAMRTWGYVVEPTPLSLRERLLFYFVDWPINWTGVMAWRVLKVGKFS